MAVPDTSLTIHTMLHESLTVIISRDFAFMPNEYAIGIQPESHQRFELFIASSLRQPVATDHKPDHKADHKPIFPKNFRLGHASQ